MPEKPLYADAMLKVTIAEPPEEHLLWIKKRNWTTYVIPRNCLREFALTPRARLESKLDTFNPEIMYNLREKGLTADSVHVAFCQAYIEDERRIRDCQLDEASKT